jgi:hypothetical protein
MSEEIRADQAKWEYRHRSFEPSGAGCGEQDADFIDWMVKTLEKMDLTDEGWQMVSAKIESDDRGRSWLNVLQKRRQVGSQRFPGSTVPHAA